MTPPIYAACDLCGKVREVRPVPLLGNGLFCAYCIKVREESSDGSF